MGPAVVSGTKYPQKRLGTPLNNAVKLLERFIQKYNGKNVTRSI